MQAKQEVIMNRTKKQFIAAMLVFCTFIGGGVVAYNDFDVGNNVIVLENNKVN